MSVAADMAPMPNGGAPVSKVEKFKWAPLGKQGRFELIAKGDIQIDHTYQRDKVSQGRVIAIARDFSWPAFGVILCARRSDSSVWCYDGQHRKLAADKRSDVNKLPCMVFQAEDVKAEARSFLLSNTVRGAMASLDKYRALLACEDETAIGIRDLARKTGHQIGAGHVRCVAFLMKAYIMDPDCLRRTWPIAVRIAQDKQVTDELVKAAFTAERIINRTKQGTLASRVNQETLTKLTYAQFDQALAKAKAYFGGGERSCARAIIDCLNYSRTTNRIDIDKVDDE